MSKNDFVNQIHRYLIGQCTPEEKRKIEHWMRQHPENRQTFEAIKKIWEVEPEKELRANLAEAWNRLEQQMAEKEHTRRTQKIMPLKPAAKRKTGLGRSTWMRVAAILIVGVLLSLFAVRFYDIGREADSEFASQHEMVMQEVRTDRAHQSRMTFSDGTEVRLNSASMIRFPKQFDSNVREVYLEGEAWFDVRHNPDVEFIVHTPDATVRVLGTEFNVKAYADEPEVEVVVADGLVAVQAAEAASEVLLQKGEMSRLIRGQGPAPAQQVNVENYISWLRGTFVFDETPFARVAAEWERRFDVDIEVTNDALLATPFTGEFRYESFDEMLRLTSVSLEFEYARENNTITITR